MSKFYYKGESIMNSFDLGIALESLDTAIDDIEIVEEGVGRDAAKFAKEERFRQLKQYSRDYKKAYKSKDYDEALQIAYKSIDLARELKIDVDKNIGEPDSFFAKIASNLIPIFSGLASVEDNGSVVTIYSDDLSRNTNNGGKRKLQEQLNLFIKTMQDNINKVKYKIAVAKRKQLKINPIGGIPPMGFCIIFYQALYYIVESEVLQKRIISCNGCSLHSDYLI